MAASLSIKGCIRQCNYFIGSSIAIYGVPEVVLLPFTYHDSVRVLLGRYTKAAMLPGHKPPDRPLF